MIDHVTRVGHTVNRIERRCRMKRHPELSSLRLALRAQGFGLAEGTNEYEIWSRSLDKGNGDYIDVKITTTEWNPPDGAA